MKSILGFVLALNGLTTIAMANEEAQAAHHAPSITDFGYPTLNFIILVGFLIWKLKGPITEMFNKKSEDIKSLMESASKQSKDAEERLTQFQAKIKNLDSEMVKISAEYEAASVNFAKMQQDETLTTISRMKKDLTSKLEGERKELLDEINHELLNLVVKKTQSTIGSNKEYQNKATNKIIGELR